MGVVQAKGGRGGGLVISRKTLRLLAILLISASLILALLAFRKHVHHTAASAATRKLHYRALRRMGTSAAGTTTTTTTTTTLKVGHSNDEGDYVQSDYEDLYTDLYDDPSSTGQSGTSEKNTVTSGTKSATSDTDDLALGTASSNTQSLAPLVKDESVYEESKKLLTELGFPNVIGGSWPSGLPFFDVSIKQSSDPWNTGIQLPLAKVDVSKMQDVLKGIPNIMWDDDEQRVHNAYVEGRDQNMADIKPGCGTIWLVFSDQKATEAFRFPYYDYFKSVLEPVLLQILGPGGLTKILRLQFALMPPDGVIHLHPDGGGWAHKAHRIHVPVTTNPNITFEICPKLTRRCKEQGKSWCGEREITEPNDCVALPMHEGMVSELNNVVPHRVFNHGDMARIHLVVDAMEEQLPTAMLAVGASCKYEGGAVVCPAGAIASTVAP